MAVVSELGFTPLTEALQEVIFTASFMAGPVTYFAGNGSGIPLYDFGS